MKYADTTDRKRILWIEDEAEGRFSWYASPLRASGKYELIVALNTTDGLKEILSPNRELAAIIVDIRIPCGRDSKWVEHYLKYGSNKTAARQGLALLQSLLRPEIAEVKLPIDIPIWLKEKKTRIALFTVEPLSVVNAEMEELGIVHYRSKSAHSDRLVLLNLVEEVIAANGNNEA